MNRREFLQGVGAWLVSVFVPKNDVKVSRDNEFLDTLKGVVAKIKSDAAAIEGEPVVYEFDGIYAGCQEQSISREGEIWYTIDGLTWQIGTEAEYRQAYLSRFLENSDCSFDVELHYGKCENENTETHDPDFPYWDEYYE